MPSQASTPKRRVRLLGAEETCYIARPMSYTVLARKYRPQVFSDLVGQEHVTRTLSNAIEAGRVAHAFLFTGVRGVGKTTTARILAKALNCEQGPTPSPCGVCDACREIAAGIDMDVLEMDGASNNSVEDVRRLQESIPYRPARDRFKVVIVDEVHMLSTGAFNAFLKTLEEPPSHVKFIFATTEVHKVPVTIRSRCQRYDFRMIREGEVADRVRTILAAEEIKADDASVSLVAREAAGSMRDALTLLDQLVAFAGNELVGENVASLLGIADREAVRTVTESLLKGDGAAVLRAIDGLAERGLDMLHFARQLLGYVRDLTVLNVAGAESELVAMVAEERNFAVTLSAEVGVDELSRAFSALAKLVEDVGQSSTPRTTLEMGLVRIATRPPLKSLAELIAKLEQLQPGGLPPSDGGHSSGRSGSEPGPTRTSSRSAVGAAPREIRSKPATIPPNPPPAPTRTAPAQAEPAPGDGDSRTSSPPPTASAEASMDKPASAETPTSSASLWARIVREIENAKPALAALLAHGIPLEVTSDRIVIGYEKDSFFGRQVESQAGRQAVGATAKRITGRDFAVDVRYLDELPTSTQSMVSEEQTAREEAEAQTRQRALAHPTVLEAQKVFDVPSSSVQVHLEAD